MTRGGIDDLVGGRPGPRVETGPVTARGRVAKAPATVADPLTVVLDNFSRDHDYEVPADQWTGSPPAVGDRCLVVFDDDGDVWVVVVPAVGAVSESLPWLDPYDYGYDPVATDNEVALNATVAALPDGTDGKRGGILFPGPDIKCSGEITGLHYSEGVRWMGRAGPTNWPANGAQSQLRFLQANAVTGRAVDVRSSKGFTVEKMTVTNENDDFLGNLFDFEWYDLITGEDSAGMVFRDVFLGGRGEKGSGLGGYARCGTRLKRAIDGLFDNVIYQWMEHGATGQEEEAGGVRYSNAHTWLSCTWARLCNGLLNPGLDWDVISPLVEGFANGDGVDPASFFRSFVKLDYTATFAPVFGGIKVKGGGAEDSFTCDYWFDPGANGCWRGVDVDGFNMYAGKVLKQVNPGNSKNVAFRSSAMGDASVGVGDTDHVLDCGADGIDGLVVENCDLSGGGAAPVKRLDRRARLLNNTYQVGVSQDFLGVPGLQRAGGGASGAPAAGSGIVTSALEIESNGLAGRLFYIVPGAPVVGPQYRVTLPAATKGTFPPIVHLEAENAFTAAERGAGKIFVPALSKSYFEVHANPVHGAGTIELSFVVVG